VNNYKNDTKESGQMIAIEGTKLMVQNLREGQGTRRITIIAADQATLDDSWQVIDGTNIVI
jgi:hypothetical protein